MLPNKADSLRHAEQLAGQGNINAAIAVYRGLIEADPSTSIAFRRSAISTSARAAFRKRSMSWPDSPTA